MLPDELSAINLLIADPPHPVLILIKLFKLPCPHPAKHIHTPFSVFIAKEGLSSTWKGHSILNCSAPNGTSTSILFKISVQSIIFSLCWSNPVYDVIFYLPISFWKCCPTFYTCGVIFYYS